MSNKIKSYIIGILLPIAVGGLSAFLTRGSMDIYQSIVKPELAPSAIVFPIVWTLLYALMGVGSTIIFNSDAGANEKSRALLIYALQLMVNFFWSILFFNQRAFLSSFVWIIILWVLIVAMIVSFYKINKTAALLQIPYLLWVTFAAYLTLMIYLLNR